MARRESDVIVRNLNAQRTVFECTEDSFEIISAARGCQEHRDLRSGMPPEPSGRAFRPRIGSNRQALQDKNTTDNFFNLD